MSQRGFTLSMWWPRKLSDDQTRLNLSFCGWAWKVRCKFRYLFRPLANRRSSQAESSVVATRKNCYRALVTVHNRIDEIRSIRFRSGKTLLRAAVYNFSTKKVANEITIVPFYFCKYKYFSHQFYQQHSRRFV